MCVLCVVRYGYSLWWINVSHCELGTRFDQAVTISVVVVVVIRKRLLAD